jgi:GxxExxY protein
MTIPRVNLDDPLTELIIGRAMRVHSTLGAGFVESVYRRALLVELLKAGMRAEEGRRIRVLYDGIPVGDFVADVVVEDKVILELKAVAALRDEHHTQTVNYLAATGIEVGLLINFGCGSLQFKRKFRNRQPTRQD